MGVLYFAYGSNMASKHLRPRIRSAKPIGRAVLGGKKVIFNKQSKDGSGKANLVDSPTRCAWGVLYEIDDQDLDKLDRVEGNYHRTTVKVRRPDGGLLIAETYVSDYLTEQPVAYDWYKKRVLEGAREHGLPNNYIAYLKRLPSRAEGTKPETSS